MRAGPARASAPPRVPATLTPAHLTANQRTGRDQAAARGWTGQQWACLFTLWTRESRWDHRAQNPTSTAYGVAQFLNRTWAPYGPKTSAPGLQIRYGLDYIDDRYGTPCAAWTAWSGRHPHWY
jgi:hypothetical protein